MSSAAKVILGKFPAVHILNGAAGYDPNGTVSTSLCRMEQICLRLMLVVR
jgi:hypothetical protein